MQGTLEREGGAEGMDKDSHVLLSSKRLGLKKRNSILTAVKIIPAEVKESIIVSGKKEASLGSQDEVENIDGLENHSGVEKMRNSLGP